MEETTSILGLIGTICISICLLPQVSKIWLTKNSQDLSFITSLFQMIGNIY